MDLSLNKVKEVQTLPFINEEAEAIEVQPFSQCQGAEVFTSYPVIVSWFDASVEIV